MHWISNFPIALGCGCVLFFNLISSHALADTVKVGGTGSALGTVQRLAEAYALKHPGSKVIAIEGLGSSGSIKAVTAGALDISLSARPLKPAERAENLTEKEIARTPLVLASMRKHDGFTMADIAKIFDGSLSTWPDNSPLRPILRPDSDAESALLRAISPETDRALSMAHQRKGVHLAITDQDSADAIEKIPGAVGTSTLALILSERRKITALPLNGVAPSLSSLAEGRYHLYKPLYLITRQTPSDSAQGFIAFIHSKVGHQVLSDNGFLLKP